MKYFALVVSILAFSIAACRREYAHEPIRPDIDYDKYYNKGETYYPPK